LDQAADLAEHCTAFRHAPVTVVVLYKAPTAISLSFLAGVEDAELVSGEFLSAALATQNLLLAAHAVGLGACVMTGPLVAREAVEREVDLPPGYKVVCLVALGFPAECPKTPRRKRLEQIVEFRGGERSALSSQQSAERDGNGG
jgi:nitroreductase